MRSWRDRYAYSPREAIGKVRDFRKPRGKFVACERQTFLLRSSPLRDVSRGGIIDLRHQYGISVAESQTFLPAKLLEEIERMDAVKDLEDWVNEKSS